MQFSFWCASGRALRLLLAALGLGSGLCGFADSPPVPSTEPDGSSGTVAEEIGELHRLAETLWSDYAPEAVKAEYELMPREEWISLFELLSAAGAQQDLRQFADFAPATREALSAVRELPEFAELTDWLGARLDEMELASEYLITPAPPLPPDPAPPHAPAPLPPSAPTPTPAPSPDAPPAAPVLPPKVEVEPLPATSVSQVPLLDEWLTRLKARPEPSRAATYLPVARAAFAAALLPPELVWLAETESAFNPRARSPVGAKGLFQLMPATARSLGLSLWPRDERADPKRSAEAAAAYLHQLYQRFGDWPLTLAAYNAGEGRVARTLAAHGARDFASIADKLPSETRLYVPKVLATVQTRTGVSPSGLETVMRRK